MFSRDHSRHYGHRNLVLGVTEVNRIAIAAALALLLSAAGCATTADDSNNYRTANVESDTRSDAIEGLDPEESVEYPMLHYVSPGISRMNRER